MQFVGMFVDPRALYAEFGCESRSVHKATSSALAVVGAQQFDDSLRERLDVGVIKPIAGALGVEIWALRLLLEVIHLVLLTV